MCAGKVTLSLLAGGLFSQIVCMIFSAIEMKLSEKASMNSTEEFYIGLQTLSLIGMYFIFKREFNPLCS